MNSPAEIQDVTDTALWVAAYRAEESLRKDAFFKDPLAALLVGEIGTSIATRTQGSRFTAWSVVIRTRIIDQFIAEVLCEGIDTVINLGAGLDTRPYRLDLPQDLRWIEVDFPKIINLKNEKLKDEKPRCKLERLSLNLAKDEDRRDFLKKTAYESKKVLILTEGVVPYLTNEQARDLARDLKSHANFKYWITEYYSPEILEFLRTPKRLKQMINSPFLFYPEDWFGFYRSNGWTEKLTKYFGIESANWGRTPPTPSWLANDPSKKEAVKKFLGYSLFTADWES